MTMQHSRFAFLTGATAVFLAAPAVAAPGPSATPTPPPECRLAPVSPAAARQRLVDGNVRFMKNKTIRRNPIRRRAELPGQCPFATVVACSDSRVPPETVFDQDLGELFTCRVAGTVADTPVTGSIEYASGGAFKPAPGIVVVLGHEGCGAVKAALDTLNSGVLPGSSVGPLVREILPNVRKGMALDEAVKANAIAVARTLRMSPVLKPQLGDGGSLAIVPAYYHLVSGLVEFLAEPTGAAPRRPLAFL
jgi:carbonic anhydrase